MYLKIETAKFYCILDFIFSLNKFFEKLIQYWPTIII